MEGAAGAGAKRGVGGAVAPALRLRATSESKAGRSGGALVLSVGQAGLAAQQGVTAAGHGRKRGREPWQAAAGTAAA